MSKPTTELETFTVFNNVDRTILLLNPLLQNIGYQFEVYTLDQVEVFFYELFDYQKKNNSRMELKLNNCSVDYDFYQAITMHILCEKSVFDNEEMIFLKKNENHKPTIIENKVDISKSFSITNAIKNVAEEIIRKLRLFKNGDIYISATFQIDMKTRKIFHKQYSRQLTQNSNSIYSIRNNEVLSLHEHFNKDYGITDLTKIAELYFEKTYQTSDFLTKYIGLITALEAIFNKSKDQISHIIARHLSLIISKNIDEFKTNYKRMKKLYGYRSELVHGQKENIKEDIVELTNEAQDLVRKAILYCSEKNVTKDELFDFLNTKGV